jgi:glycosyltransferase involved in cell wall biosynthesis
MYAQAQAPTRPEREAPASIAAGAARPAVAKRRPHVCFVAPTTWPILASDHDIPVVGGAELQQTVLSTELARRGWPVSMICLDYGQEEGVVVDGVRVLRMHKPDEGLPVVRYIHPRLTSLWSAMKRADADVYYQRTSAAYTGFIAAFCARYGRASVYAGASDVDFLPGEEDIRYLRDRKIFEYGLRHVDRVIVQNSEQERRLSEHYGRDSLLVPNCFAAPPGARADRHGYILWVATMREIKRPEVVFEMARRLPHLRFVMIGGPDDGTQAYYEKMRLEAATVPNLEFRGFMPFDQADRCFDGARLVINTSHYEGFPNTFLQAWARGVPTLAFIDTGSTLDGELVYDRVDDLEQACVHTERLMRDDVYWERASQRVRAYFNDHHSVDAIVQCYEREFARLARPR